MALCSVSDCPTSTYALGFCKKHWMRNRRHGDPLGGGQRRSVAELQAWLDAVPADAACGEADWPFSVSADGYGRFGRSGRCTHYILARFAGPAPAGKPWALHRCDRPVCCAPACLYWGDVIDNAHDRETRGRGRPPSKLSVDDVRLMRDMRELLGSTRHELAERFGVGPCHVDKILRGGAWSNR